MIDIFKNNLNNFDINNKTNNTIICNANEIENSHILNSLSPIQKSTIHLNIKVSCDKDIENFIYLEQDCNYKSINLILNSNFDLSKTACQKLSNLINLNSILKYNDDNKFKGYSFKNYCIASTTLNNHDTTQLLSDDTLYTLKNFSKKENGHITFFNIINLSKEILNFFKEKNYDKIYINVNPDTTLDFNIDLLYTIFERINNYTNSINLNIENTLKFNIIYNKVLDDINNDFENKDYNLYNDLFFSGYHFILYQTLRNLNINANLIPCKILGANADTVLKYSKTLDQNIDTYYIQLNFDKYWFNLDIVWNYNYLKDDPILKNDKEFFKTHYTECKEIEKCTITYKKFYKRYKLFKTIKNKFLLILGKNKKELLGLPAPNAQCSNNNNSIFQHLEKCDYN